MKRNPRRGYTLLELLITLTIIGVLAGVLLPVSTHCGENAPRSSCQSNLKQVGLAFLQYAQDYDERMPPIALNAVPASLPPYARPYGWADALQPYCKSTQIFQCPSEKSASSEDATTDATQPGFVDYWFNTNLGARPLKTIANPTFTLLAGEGNDGRDGSDARYNRNVFPQSWLAELPPELEMAARPPRRHLDTANYLFADGHVKALKAETVVANNSFALNAH